MENVGLKYRRKTQRGVGSLDQTGGPEIKKNNVFLCLRNGDLHLLMQDRCRNMCLVLLEVLTTHKTHTTFHETPEIFKFT